MNKKLLNALLCALLAGASISIYAGDSCSSGMCGDNIDDMDAEMMDEGMNSMLEEEEMPSAAMNDDDIPDFSFGDIDDEGRGDGAE